MSLRQDWLRMSQDLTRETTLKQCQVQWSIASSIVLINWVNIYVWLHIQDNVDVNIISDRFQSLYVSFQYFYNSGQGRVCARDHLVVIGW